MTRIGNSPASPKAAPEAGSSKLEGHDKAPPGRIAKSGQGKPVDKAKGLSAKTREGVFEQKIAQAISKTKQAPEQPEGKADMTLLVMLHPVGDQASGANIIPASVSQAVPGGPASIHRVEWAEGLINRIEHAFQTGTKTGGDSITISLDIGVQELGGIGGIEISMSPSALDVVLTRTEGQASIEYLAATHALAERLQDRFSRRIIRIHEVAVSRKKSSPQGLEEISQILGKSEPMR